MKELWESGLRSKAIGDWLEENNFPPVKLSSLAKYGERNWATQHVVNLADVSPEDLGELSEQLKEQGLEITGINSTSRMGWGWEKNVNGENQQVKRTTNSFTVKATPKKKEDKEKFVFEKGTVADINISIPKLERHSRPKNMGLAISMPDTQIGYFTEDDGSISTVHDEAAINVAHQLIGYIQATEGVDMVVYQGDNVDFPTFSKYKTAPGSLGKVQMSLNRLSTEAATARELAPDAEIAMLGGNHDQRQLNYLSEHMPDMIGVKRVGETKSIFDISYLCRFDDYDVEYIDSYPDGEVWANEGLKFIHGKTVKSALGATAAATLASEGVSTAYGHHHHAALVYDLIRSHRGSESFWAGSAGCLCRIDGAVPSGQVGFNSVGGTNKRKDLERWQQGIMVIYYDKDGINSYPEIIPIRNGNAIFRGQLFTATCDVNGNDLKTK